MLQKSCTLYSGTGCTVYPGSDCTFYSGILTFFKKAKLNQNAYLITGVICGYRIEEIDNPVTKQIRYLDKLVDELAKGRKMEKILRTT